MHTYKFRMIVEDQDDFVRDYEISSNQTFLDLYNIIRKTVTLQGNELASFFICDSKWRKKKEITLLDMLDETIADTIPDEDEDDEFRSPIKKLPTFTMDNAKIKDFIEDPAQRILLEYDFLNPSVFFIELFKIFDARPDVEYPHCVKSVGELILPYRLTDHSVPLPDEEDELLPELDEEDEPSELIDDDLTALGFNNDTKW